MHRIVRFEAAAIGRRFPSGVISVKDLEGFGHIGLLEARDRFDPRRKVNFKTFARHRIRGAIFDGIRKTGLLRRRAYESVRRQIIAWELLGEPIPQTAVPTRSNDAQVIGSAIAQMATAFMADAILHGPEPVDPETSAEKRQNVNRMHAVLAELSERDRQVIKAIYDFEESGDSGAKLAERWGTTRSSISRRHQTILLKLKARMVDTS